MVDCLCMNRRLPNKGMTYLADFIASAIEFLPIKERKSYDKLLENIEEQKPLTEERVAEAALTLAIATWPARQALSRHLKTDGKSLEWERLSSAVRHSTAALLKKLQKSHNDKSVDDALSTADAATLIKEDEETEIRFVRDRVRLEIWQAKKKELVALMKETEKELQDIQKRFDKLRDTAFRSPRDTEAMLQKLETYEDNVLFKGETIPLEILDQDIAFAIENVELPPEG